MAQPQSPCKPPRTDVAAFLRAVGAELRAADEFLCRTGAPCQPAQPAAAAVAPLRLLPAAAASPGDGLQAPAAGTSGGSSNCGEAAAEDEVAALMGLLLPAQADAEPQPEVAAAPTMPAGAAAQRRGGQEAAPAAAAVPRASGKAGPLTAPAAQEGTPAEQRRSRAKVLSWLSHSGSGRQLTDDSPSDAIPALHAAAPRPAAARPAAKVADRWRSPPRSMPAPALRAPVRLHPPADYCEQLHQAGPPRKLLLARPACAACGNPRAACGCTEAAAAAPLRLLHSRQPAHASPGRHRHEGGSPGAASRQQRHQAPSAACPAPAAVPGVQAACVSIGSIQHAYFGSGGPQACSWQPPPAAPPALLPPPPPPSVAAACVNPAVGSGGEPQMDVSQAYLAARRQAAAAASAAPAPSQAGGGPLAELRAIAQRIRGMQGHISSFLLQQRGGPAPAAMADPGASAGGCLPHASSTARAPPAAAARAAARPAAGPAQVAPAGQGQGAELFDDDFILSMQLGADWRQLERATLAAAAERSSAAGASAGEPSSGVAQGGALERLKEAQRVVTAVRVGRQGSSAAAGHRAMG